MLLRATQVALDELASNTSQRAKNDFSGRASRLIEEASSSRRKELQRESEILSRLLDAKIKTHLQSRGEPESWPAPAP